MFAEHSFNLSYWNVKRKLKGNHSENFKIKLFSDLVLEMRYLYINIYLYIYVQATQRHLEYIKTLRIQASFMTPE